MSKYSVRKEEFKDEETNEVISYNVLKKEKWYYGALYDKDGKYICNRGDLSTDTWFSNEEGPEIIKEIQNMIK